MLLKISQWKLFIICVEETNEICCWVNYTQTPKFNNLYGEAENSIKATSEGNCLPSGVGILLKFCWKYSEEKDNDCDV